MATIQTPKETSYEYGKDYQETMRGYYYQSKVASELNTEYVRVRLANELIHKYALPRLGQKSPNNITLVDVGCSVGLFAIEFSKKGFNSFGIDFDPAALEIAKKFNKEDEANATFMQMDISDWNLNNPIDIAICFDIFEHLHDDELGSLLQSLRKKLSKHGSLVFHTLPMQYDYLFWSQKKSIIQFPWFLKKFRWLKPSRFSRLVEIYALCLDIAQLVRGGITHKESIKMSSHCNPLTYERLKDILIRSGYDILHIESGFLGESQFNKQDSEYFHKQKITHRSLRGVAIPKD